MKRDNLNTFRVTSIFVQIAHKNNDNLLPHSREKLTLWSEFKALFQQ